MHRALILFAALLVTGCDPGVYETLRITPRAAQPKASTAAQAPDALAGIELVAARFGLRPLQTHVDRDTRDWQAPIEANGHTQLYVRARPAAGGMTVIVGEMYTNRWSPRGDSLRRAIADTLKYLGAVAP